MKGDRNERENASLRIGKIKADKCIIQGGMGVGISGANLAAAVAAEGGIGVIASVGLGFQGYGDNSDLKRANRSALREEIRKARKKTNGVIGVNIMVALTDFDEHVRIAVEEDVDVVFMGAGLPLKNPIKLPLSKMKDIRTRFVPKVSSAKAVNVIFKYWDKHYNHIPDAVMIEGPLTVLAVCVCLGRGCNRR